MILDHILAQCVLPKFTPKTVLKTKRLKIVFINDYSKLISKLLNAVCPALSRVPLCLCLPEPVARWLFISIHLTMELKCNARRLCFGQTNNSYHFVVH